VPPGSHLAVAALLLLLASVAAAAQSARTTPGWQLVDPWPSAEQTAGISGRPVAFPSSSPFTPLDLPDAEPAMAVGTLYRRPQQPRARQLRVRCRPS
jgi:hypothetical protein